MMKYRVATLAMLFFALVAAFMLERHNEVEQSKFDIEGINASIQNEFLCHRGNKDVLQKCIRIDFKLKFTKGNSFILSENQPGLGGCIKKIQYVRIFAISNSDTLDITSKLINYDDCSGYNCNPYACKFYNINDMISKYNENEKCILDSFISQNGIYFSLESKYVRGIKKILIDYN